jgi:hypothetical protein
MAAVSGDTDSLGLAVRTFSPKCELGHGLHYIFCRTSLVLPFT